MKTSDFFYNLPNELIAQVPVEPRDSSRMLVYDRHSMSIEHKHFYDLPHYLKKGDVLVINNTKVIPARIFGTKVKSGGKIEFLLLKRLDYTHWEVLTKPGRIAKVGAEFVFGENLKAKICDVIDEGVRIVEFTFDGVFEDVLSRIGEMPLPPYIKTKLQDQKRYNTVYSEIEGSAAAPTAGLHFTDELLATLQAQGVRVVKVLLNVGLGTFRPVKEDAVEEHKMHTEYFRIDQAAADEINSAKREGRRVIAVGTTSVRVLESAAVEKGKIAATSGDTNIFIYPPYDFKIVDGLITNFHLPESTLLMLVSAFCSREEILRVYNVAVEQKYRFFSFGDATLLL